MSSYLEVLLTLSPRDVPVVHLRLTFTKQEKITLSLKSESPFKHLRRAAPFLCRTGYCLSQGKVIPFLTSRKICTFYRERTLFSGVMSNFLHMGKAAPFLEERLTISQGKPGHITEEI
jgi:hypothetical protein